MGKPDAVHTASSRRMTGRVPGEVKHLSTQRKRKRTFRRKADAIPSVAASEKGKAQTYSFVSLLILE